MGKIIIQIEKNEDGFYDIPNCLCYTCKDSVPKNPQYYCLINNNFFHGNKKYVKYEGWYFITKKSYRKVLLKE